LRDFAALCVSVYGGGSYKIIPFPHDRKPIDIGDYYSDFRKIRGALGWQPRVSLREGLARTLEFYRVNKEKYG
jgi:UDP-glucose 4-epimerase